MTSDIPTRPRVFLDVQSGAEFLGRIIVELFSDKTPKTCENFRSICTSSHTPAPSAKPLTYKGSPFHRIIDEFMIQGGDVTAGNGTGGASIYGRNFEDENLGWRKIDAVGLVCMANIGKGTNSSQFFITLAPCEHLNAKHTVFGHVVKGMDVCEQMAKVPVDKKDRPLTEAIISHCGELERRPKQGVAPTLQSTEPNGERHSMKKNQTGASRRFRSPGDTKSIGSPSRAPSKRPRHRERSTSPQRRRSDTGLDENRRGRTSTRSTSSKDDSSQSRPRSRHHRRRSSPPSTSRSQMRSQSPHMRRSTADRNRSPRHGGADHLYRQRWENHSKRDEGQLDRRRDRYQSSYDGKPGNHLSNESRVRMLLGHNGGGRLGAEDGLDGSGVKFKGRGSMKYREPKR
ncbi:MAG: hypothetical protein LQ352_000563 [Teloschistes flavicans]|nr:MAG: hypothetical protein LQ352_000563 [Teloschistes flavicans]